MISFRPAAALALAGSLALAACNKSETTYEADATDESGGELIVSTDTAGVPVDLPTTAMTPVPDAAATGAMPAASATPMAQ